MILFITPNPAVDKIMVVTSWQPETPLRSTFSITQAGGGGIHAARVAHSLGAATLSVCVAGGTEGTWLRELLDQAHLPHMMVPISGRTRMTVTVLEEGRSNVLELAEAGPTISTSEFLEFESTVRSLLISADLVVLSGSLAPGIPSDFYQDIVTYARQLRKDIIVDSSGETLFKTLSANPFLIKPNLLEFSRLIGEDVHGWDLRRLAVACQSISKEGPQYIALSLGENGVLFASEGEAYWLSPPSVTAINTVGCGDTMIGAFSAHFVSSGDPLESIRTGIAAATANTTYPDVAYCTHEDIERYLPDITVKRVV